ncbi:MAG: amidase [Pirellulaceae bacterium]
MLPSLPSIAEAQTLMRRGKLRPIDLVEHCLGRIHQFEDEIHAWVMVDDEGSKAEARRLGKMLDDGQEPVGPLHGIPIGIKDIIDVAGWPTLCGSKLRAGHLAEKDAAVVASLRKAGAIILGKTVTTEWASFDPPPTRNPWNLNHTPGGSSSGSAAAVAMEMCLAALGTQTGGSIIRPASYCGVVGLKPNFGWISREGIFPFSLHLDHVGPIARCIEDAVQTYACFSRSHLSSESFHLSEADSLMVRWLEGGILAEEDTETQRHFAGVRSRLSEYCGNESLAMPEFLAPARTIHRCIMAVEGAEVHRVAFERREEDFGHKIRSLINEGRQPTALDFANSLRRQAEIQIRSHDTQNWFEGHSRVVWAMPSTPTAAPGVETTGDPVFNSLWSLAGLTTITIPCGLNEHGLPFGLQLIGTFEDDVAKAAFLCESALAFSHKPPLLKQKR